MRATAPDVSAFLATAVAAVRTAAAVLFVAVYTLVVGPPGTVLALVFRRPMILYHLGAGGVWGALFFTGLRFRVAGGEHIQRARAAVYAVNHSSNVEPPILYLALRELFPRFQILYKAEIHRIPVLAQGFDVVGFVPIDRGNREKSSRAIQQAVKQIREGNSFLVFPEGTRSRSGELLRFKKGAFIMALEAQAPIVPVAITGAHAAMRRGSPIIWPVTIGIRFGVPVETAGLPIEERDHVIRAVRERIAALLADASSAAATSSPEDDAAAAPAPDPAATPLERGPRWTR